MDRLKRLLKYIKKYKIKIVFSSFLSIILVFVTLYIPMLVAERYRFYCWQK